MNQYRTGKDEFVESEGVAAGGGCGQYLKRAELRSGEILSTPVSSFATRLLSTVTLSVNPHQSLSICAQTCLAIAHDCDFHYTFASKRDPCTLPYRDTWATL